MLLVLPGIRQHQLSGTVPVIFNSFVLRATDGKDYPQNLIAQPNTTLVLVNGRAKLDKNNKPVFEQMNWGCSDWIVFHQGLVSFFREGKFASKIKYSEKDAITQANKIVTQHWDKNAGILNTLLCGHNSNFAEYFTKVGLGNAVTLITQRVANKTIDTAVKISGSVQDTLVNVVDGTGKVVNNVVDTAGNFAGLAKYAIPAIVVGGVVFVGAYAYKNFIKGDSRITVPTPAGFVKV